MAFTAFTTSTNIMTQLVFQPGHGFPVGQLVRYDGTQYILSLADDEVHCAGTVMVSIVIDTANFYVTQVGYVVIPTASFTPGIQYYLSPGVSGDLTSTKPTSIGEVLLECFVADSANTGFFWGGSGETIVANEAFQWSTITVDQVLAVNQGYFINGASQLSLQLPATAMEGDTIVLHDIGGFGYITVQRANQFCYMGSGVTTTGVTGYLQTVMQGAKVTMVCQTPGASTIYACVADFGIFSTF